MSRPKPTVLFEKHEYDLSMGYFVYELRDSRNTLPFYVGKSNRESRPLDHIREAITESSGNKLKTNTINKIIRDDASIVINFVFWSIHEKDTLAEEQRLIKFYGRRDIGTGPLVNLTDGGEGTSGYTHSNESKEKISNALRTRSIDVRKKAADKLKGKPSGMTGKKHTDETKITISTSVQNSESFKEAMNSRKCSGSDNSFYGKTHTETAKEAMSSWKKENYKKENNPFYGKKHKPETIKSFSENNPAKRQDVKDKISKALKGRPWSEARRNACRKEKSDV